MKVNDMFANIDKRTICPQLDRVSLVLKELEKEVISGVWLATRTKILHRFAALLPEVICEDLVRKCVD